MPLYEAKYHAIYEESALIRADNPEEAKRILLEGSKKELKDNYRWQSQGNFISVADDHDVITIEQVSEDEWYG